MLFRSKTVDASANTGGLTYVSAATAGSTTITGSATAANTLTGGVTADTITGGAKNDTITSGTGLDVLKGGDGSDTFVLSANANGNTYATISDLTKTAGGVTGDIIDATALKAHGNLNTSFAAGDKVVLADTAAFADYLNAAAAGDGSVNSHAKWFVYGGNTYIVEDKTTNAAGTFAATDIVVKLTGLVDLSTATGAGTHIITLA